MFALILTVEENQSEATVTKKHTLDVSSNTLELLRKAEKITQYLEALTERNTRILDIQLEIVEETLVVCAK